MVYISVFLWLQWGTPGIAYYSCTSVMLRIHDMGYIGIFKLLLYVYMVDRDGGLWLSELLLWSYCYIPPAWVLYYLALQLVLATWDVGAAVIRCLHIVGRIVFSRWYNYMVTLHGIVELSLYEYYVVRYMYYALSGMPFWVYHGIRQVLDIRAGYL